MNRHEDTMAVLRAANPVPAEHVAFDARAGQDLRRILAAPAGQPARREHRRTVRRLPRVVTAAAAVCALVLGGSIVTGGGWVPGVSRSSAYAATPPPLQPQPAAGLAAYGLDAAAVSGPARLLSALAAKVEALPDDVGSGRYARISTEGWALWTTVDGEQVTSEVVPTSGTTWVAADGSGRGVSTSSPGGKRRVSDERFGPGTRPFYWPPGSISTEAADLEAQLAHAHPVENGPAERFVAVADLYREQPLPPRTRAAVLRFISRTPGLLLTGLVKDRLGRDGLAVALDSDYSGLPTRYTLVFDPISGALFGQEALLTTTAGKLNVPVPSVISYTAFRESRYVDGLE